MSDDDDVKNVNLDEIFDQIGQIGPYQILILILVSFTSTIAATNAYSLIFTNAKPDFRYSLSYLLLLFKLGECRLCLNAHLNL